MLRVRVARLTSIWVFWIVGLFFIAAAGGGFIEFDFLIAYFGAGHEFAPEDE